ncbi:MAG: AraC family transcriptional regulator [Lentisphaeria bacterium]|nr:AraC family transcriptional regulator [Lentisphaeria bacterium]
MFNLMIYSLLSCSNMPIDDIALECGFVNSNYFYKMFRLKLNTTPGAYRKKSLLAQE